MKKSLIAIVVIVVVILLVAPNIVGGGIQSATVQTLMAMVPDQANQTLDIRQTEFRRGWFSSAARIEISVAELDALTGEPISLILDMDINHGPLLLTPGGIRLGLAHADINPSISGFNPEDIEPDGEIESTTPSATMFAGFDNNVEVVFQLDNFQASNVEAI
ncbi:MAG: YdgA family protein, partial [Gammaproteobacteria bacterium]|nr:YdgA family protein [Gammaproteobacteria bacterium]